VFWLSALLLSYFWLSALWTESVPSLSSYSSVIPLKNSIFFEEVFLVDRGAFFEYPSLSSS
jgi:hypothetical protein